MKFHIPSYQYVEGFKINDAHFKLGSKLHISDFYFARVMYQNSFYANRFGFLVSQKIIEVKILESKNKIALIGYGKYSEQLVENIKEFLQQYYLNEKTIEIDYISDQKDLKFLQNNINISKEFYFVIIMPIASTLSTAAKIIDVIREKIFPDTEIEKLMTNSIGLPIFCPLMVMDKDVQEQLKIDTKEHQGLFKLSSKKSTYRKYLTFNWVGIDLKNKIIQIKIFNRIDIDVCYLIELSTKWNPIYDCNICIPQENEKGIIEYENEKPLIETDDVSVSPVLLLDGNFQYNNNKFFANPDGRVFRIPFLLPDYHIYDHFKFSNKTYLHFINPTIFLQKHYDQIEYWIANELKIRTKASFINSNRVVLVAPEGSYNSSFPTYINKLLFNNKAYLIHLNLKSDHIENYILYYGSILKDAEHIFYVDDLMTLGNSFSSANNFVHLASATVENINGKDIDGMIVLISRADDFTLKKVNRKLKCTQKDSSKIYNFIQFNVPDISPPHLPCPLVNAYNEIQNLAMQSNLDTIKQLYLQRGLVLTIKNELPPYKAMNIINYDSRLGFWEIKKDVLLNMGDMAQTVKYMTYHIKNKKLDEIYPRNLNKFIVTHFLYSDQFLFESIRSKGDTKSRLDAIINNVYEKMDTGNLQIYPNAEPAKQKEKLKEYIIKIISFAPFSYHKEIKNFILQVLIFEIQQLFKTIETNRSAFQKYRYLKLLIKRLANLKSNYLISSEFLENLKKTYSFPKETRNELANQREHETKILFKFLKKNYPILANKLPDLSSVSKNENLRTLVIKLNDIYNDIVLRNDAENKDIIRYFLQEIVNNKYKTKTYTDLEYFIVSCINEATYGNEVKAVKLEENAIAISVKRMHSFYHLKRTVLLMNDGVINQMLPKLNKLYNTENKQQNSTLNNFLSALNSRKNTYEYEPLYKFLTASSELMSITGDEIHDLTLNSLFIKYYSAYLTIVLHTNTNDLTTRKEITIKNEITDILNSISGLFDDQPGISLSIKYRNTLSTTNKLENESVYYFDSNNSEGHLPSNSFSNEMLKGVTSTVNGPIQTLFETYFENNEIIKLQDNYYNNDRDKLILNSYEEIKENKYKHVVFIRISEITSVDDSNSIVNNEKGVLFIGFKNKLNPVHTDEGYLKGNILRYLLLLRKQLLEFIKKNVENDSFASYVDANKKIELLSHFSHDLKQDNKTLRQILENNNKMIDYSAGIDIYRTFKSEIDKPMKIIKNNNAAISIATSSFNQIFISQLILKKEKPQTIPKKIHEFCDEYIAIMKELFDAEFGYGSNSYGTDYIVKTILDKKNPVEFNYDEESFSTIFIEIFKNIRKSMQLKRLSFKYKIVFEQLRENNQNYLMIKSSIYVAKSKREKIYFFVTQAKKALDNLRPNGGIELIKRVYLDFFNAEINAYIEKNNFIYKIELPFHE